MASNGGLDHLHHAKESTGGCVRFESSLAHVLQRVAIPPATQMSCPFRCVAILPGGNAGTVAATVFKEQDTAAWAADAAHFAQRLDGIGKCACAESGHDRVE